MKILITGGLGNLGSWLTRHLLSLGHEVTTLSSRDRQLNITHRFTKLFADVSDLASVQAALASHQFHAVIHLASVNEGNIPGYPKLALEINALGTRNLIQVLADKSKESGTALPHFIYFSTFHAYGLGGGHVHEQLTPTPRHDYGLTHLFAEQYVEQFSRTHGLGYTTIRLTNSYGCPLDQDSSKWYLVLNDLARSAVEQGQIKLASNGKPVRDFVWMGTVADAVAQLLTKGPADTVFNLGGGKTYSMIQVAQVVAAAAKDVLGKELPIVTNQADMTNHDTSLNVDITKLQSWINYAPHDMMLQEAKDIMQLVLNMKQPA